MNTLTYTAVIDGDPYIFSTTRKVGETNAQTEGRLLKGVAAFLANGGFVALNSLTWEWTA